MKVEERTAKGYLERLGFGGVRFEPDGNIPPDFSVGTSTGIEVRRLNQNYFGPDEPRGLEELAIPLWRILREATSGFDSQFDGRSYWVFAEYKRPSNKTSREAAKSVRDSLEDFLRRGGQAPDELVPDNNLRLAVHQSSPVQGQVFRLGGGIDQDSGGSLVPMYVDNISYCIREKSLKIAPYEDRYDTWWLLLVDFMGWGLDDRDELHIRSRIPSLERFDRLIVIDSQDGGLCLDLEDETA